MTQYSIQSKGTLNGKPLEVSTQIKSVSILDALKAFVNETMNQNITLNSIKITDGKG